MKFDKYVSNDFLIVASVLLLSAIFNKTIMNIIGNYEMFATATTTEAPVTLKDLADRDSWVNYFKSRAFWFPQGPLILCIIGMFIYLLVTVVRKPAVPKVTF